MSNEINKQINNEILEQGIIVNQKENNGEMQKGDYSQKYYITIKQATKLFGIGEGTLRRFLDDNRGAEYLSYIGNRTLIKREMFKKFLDENVIVF